jgi:uncharacterized protein DUF4349
VTTHRRIAIALAMVGTVSCTQGARPPSSAPRPGAEIEVTPQTAGTTKALRSVGYVPDRAEPQPPPAAAPTATGAGPVAAPAPLPTEAGLKLIRTARLAVEVPSYDRAAQAAARVTEEHGGYVADSRAARVDVRRRGGSVTLRVPAERFAAVLGALKALGTVTSEAVSTQDVTKAYTDLETRLRVKRDAAARVQAILNTRTARLADVLEAERELARLTEETEQMEGERRFYDQQIALSTVTLELQEPAPLMGSGEPIRAALHDALAVLVTSVAAVVYTGVFLAPWLAIAGLGWRIARRMRQAAATSPVATSDGMPGGRA